MLLQGLFVPLLCPFYRDGASYLRKLEYNVARYTLGPAAGLLALAPGGEAAGLTDAEAEATLRSVGEAAGKHKVLLAGVERNSLRAALELAEMARDAGFDAIVPGPPQDWARLVHGHDARELLTFYRTLADQAALPLVLWSEKAGAGLQLPLELIAELAQHRNVLGLADADLAGDRLSAIQEATRSVEREVTVTTVFEAVTRRMLKPEPVREGGSGLVPVESLVSGQSTTGSVAVSTSPAVPALPALKTRTRRVPFQIVATGPAGETVALLAAGVQAVAPPLASCAPQSCFEAYAAWKDNDPELARERAARFDTADRLLAELGPAAAKAGCDLNGYFGGLPRLPRLPLRAPEREALEASLAVLRN